MKTIYFVNAQGKKVYVEVSDEVAAAYRECQREEWQNDAYESYHTKSLDEIVETGHDFEDEQADIEEICTLQETQKERAALLDKLRAVMPYLTELQRQTIHKLFDLNMSQSEIAREEGVLRCTIKERVDGIFVKLKKLIEKKL